MCTAPSHAVIDDNDYDIVAVAIAAAATAKQQYTMHNIAHQPIDICCIRLFTMFTYS